MSPRLPTRCIAGDAFEAMIADRIRGACDLYDLDGETFLRSRDGRVETGAIHLLSEGGE